MSTSPSPFEIVFNHDGFGLLSELADTPLTEEDVCRVLLDPFKGSAVTAIDWCILTTGQHSCRTRHQRGFVGDGQGREIDERVGKVIAHFNRGPRDLLDILIDHGHRAGLKVFGNIRLNHWLNPDKLLSCPGRNANGKKDFRDPEFHTYLAEIVEDLTEKGVDAISLDFERKAPFFPEEATGPERIEACIRFLERVRPLTSLPVIARVCHDADKGRLQGQSPENWMRDGLVDVVVPATHNHEPDPLDWSFERFLEAASQSPRPCKVWPQIWPTNAHWSQKSECHHSPMAVQDRVEEIRRTGAHGVYFFNFCCFGTHSPFQEMFHQIKVR